MKITEETKIKDLIPEGMELDRVYEGRKTLEDEINIIKIELKEKQEKDFEWYVNEHNKQLAPFVSPTILQGMLNDTLGKSNNTPFWYKIGLLKLICEDIDSDWYRIVQHWNEYGCFQDYILKICPEDFLNSIFE